MKSPANLIEQKDLVHSQRLWVVMSRALWEAGPPAGRRREKGLLLFIQVWCAGKISDGHVVEYKYLTSAYISDSDEEEVLAQADPSGNVFLVPEPELSSKKCHSNKYR